jgi:hypothetical protein
VESLPALTEAASEVNAMEHWMEPLGARVAARTGFGPSFVA